MGRSQGDARQFLEGLFHAAVAAAQPRQSIARFLPDPPRGRTIVVGAGKGAAQMARALEDLWPGPLEGTVVTRYGYAAVCRLIEVLEAAHPVPDEAGLEGAARLLERVAGLTADDLVIALVCGGGSALLPAPPDGFTLDDEIALNEILLASGAPISAMNTIRKQFSRIKGGRLAAAAYPARVVSLLISDIPGDEAAFIASGPTVADKMTPADALRAAERYAIALPPAIRAHLETAEGAPSPDDPRLKNTEAHVIASARVSLEAAADEARKAGVTPVILSDAIEGEAREAGLFHAALALEIERRDEPFAAPVVLLSGGETTVTLKGSGKGGRNSEFLLSFAARIAGSQAISALAADTDGIDGSEDNAGAFADGETVARLAAAGLDVNACLSDNDAWTAFDAIGGLFAPGPTGTNVNDFRAILIDRRD